MKKIKEISAEEFDKAVPSFFDTLANPEKAKYCNKCDGMRIFEDNKCTSCGSKFGSHYCYNCKDFRIFQIKGKERKCEVCGKPK